MDELLRNFCAFKWWMAAQAWRLAAARWELVKPPPEGDPADVNDAKGES